MSLTRVFSISRNFGPGIRQCLYTTSAGTPTGTQPPGSEGKAAVPPKPQATLNAAGNEYQCGIYYEHNEMTFYDIECELVKQRTVPQASKFKAKPAA